MIAALGWALGVHWAWVLAGISYSPLVIWPPFSVFSAVGLGVGLFAGFKGNRWIEEHLALSGYEYLGFTWANNQEAAYGLFEEGAERQMFGGQSVMRPANRSC